MHDTCPPSPQRPPSQYRMAGQEADLNSGTQDWAQPVQAQRATAMAFCHTKRDEAKERLAEVNAQMRRLEREKRQLTALIKGFSDMLTVMRR